MSFQDCVKLAKNKTINQYKAIKKSLNQRAQTYQFDTIHFSI